MNLESAFVLYFIKRVSRVGAPPLHQLGGIDSLPSLSQAILKLVGKWKEATFQKGAVGPCMPGYAK